MYQETRFLNQDACFLNQEGRRQFLITKGFIKGEALRLLRTNSSEITFEENMRNFSTRLKNRDYPATTVEKHLSEVIFADRKKALEQRHKNASKKILPFAVTQHHPALPNLKNIVMGKWHLIENQPYLRNIFREPPIISYRKETSLRNLPSFHIAKENP